MKNFLSFVPVLLIVAGLAVYFMLRPHAYYGDPVDPPIPVQSFTLTGQKGPVSLQDYHGKLIVLFFGYTYCPDVCPTTLGTLAQAMQTMGSLATGVQVIMVSVDPDRDTPEGLAEYVANFDPSFIGVTGSKEKINAVTDANGIFYEIVPGSSADDYSINHTASLLVLDKNLNLVLLIPFGNKPAQIADDLKYLLK